MIIDSVSQIKSVPLFFKLNGYIKHAELFLKCEGLNIAGSIKLKTAQFLLDDLTKKGLITEKTKIIESSSGNLGVALSLLCKERNLSFTCVTDPNISNNNKKMLEIYGAEVITVTERDKAGGFLATRINLINKLVNTDGNYIWLNQYSNKENINAHFTETAQEIAKEILDIDYLFVGAGTTGTLMGCAKYFKTYLPHVKIIAVDAEGSVTFDAPPKTRNIPGLGTSLKPSIVDKTYFDDIIHIGEKDTIRACYKLLEKHALLVGGSTGTVVAGVSSYLSQLNYNARVVAISPDFGERYLDTIYSDIWLKEKLGLERKEVTYDD